LVCVMGKAVMNFHPTMGDGNRLNFNEAKGKHKAHQASGGIVVFDYMTGVDKLRRAA
jgi:hypothetical protein